MEIKATPLGFLAMAQLLCALLACCFPAGWKRPRCWAWIAVGVLAVGLLITRWWSVGYPPMRNVFESFLWIPLILVASTAVTWRTLNVAPIRLDATIGAFIIFPVAFVLSAEIKPLMPALQSPFFVPHVLGYMIAYALLARAFCLLLVAERSKREEIRQAGHLSFAWGFFFVTLALVLGSIWGNEVWGCYWQWDPKEQWSLATWLVYVASLHFAKQGKTRLTLYGIGLVFILLTLTWVNLSKLFPGMHSYA